MITEGQYLDALKIVRQYIQQVDFELKSREPEEKFFQSIDGLHISCRLRNSLKSNLHYCYPDYSGEWQLRHIVCISSLNQFRKFRNIGKKTVMELKDFLDGNKLTIGQSKEKHKLK